MSWRVVVLGGGFAGLAAAWAAQRGGARVTCISGKAGASGLGSGALDRVPWDERERAARLLGVTPTAETMPEDVVAFLEGLGGYVLPDGGARAPLCATTAGILRSCAGHDDALLDVGALEGRTILLPRAARAGWDADSLVRALSAAENKPRGATFAACDAPVLRFRDEERAADGELASRHDDGARLDWLARELRAAAARRGGDVAFLLGPWLGATSGRARELSARVGAPVGEILSGTAGVAGLRFEARRDALLAKTEARTVHARATRVEAAEARFAITTDGDPARVDGDAVVVAIGGLAAGGLVFGPADHTAGADGADKLEPAFRLGVAIRGARVTDGRDPGVPSSMHGSVLDEVAWPGSEGAGVLERVGLVVEARDGRLARGIFAAGDVVASRPRTVLESVASGLAAGATAAERTPSVDA
jgi:glycerol-3-phosphate dehydrogenase subunit B